MISYFDVAKAKRDAETAAKAIGAPLVGMDRKGPSRESPEDVRRRCGDKTQG